MPSPPDPPSLFYSGRRFHRHYYVRTLLRDGVLPGLKLRLTNTAKKLGISCRTLHAIMSERVAAVVTKIPAMAA